MWHASACEILTCILKSMANLRVHHSISSGQHCKDIITYIPIYSFIDLLIYLYLVVQALCRYTSPSPCWLLENAACHYKMMKIGCYKLQLKFWHDLAWTFPVVELNGTYKLQSAHVLLMLVLSMKIMLANATAANSICWSHVRYKIKGNNQSVPNTASPAV